MIGVRARISVRLSVRPFVTLAEYFIKCRRDSHRPSFVFVSTQQQQQQQQQYSALITARARQAKMHSSRGGRVQNVTWKNV